MDNSLIAHFKPKSPISEAYRMIRTNVSFASINQQIKTILITSTGPKEGKTTTTCNLAVVFAQAGNKTLIIDADLRKPRVHEVFGIENEHGILDVIMGEEPDFKNLVQKTEIENLEILPTGGTPSNPSEVLGSQKMKNLLNEINSNYDIVLIDAPPAGLVTDSAVLSTMVDGVVFVVAFGRSDGITAARAKDSIAAVGANIMGVVLNKVERHGGSYYGYYYYSKYSYNNDKGYGDYYGYYGSSTVKRKKAK